MTTAVALSIQLLMAVQERKPVAPLTEQLAQLKMEELFADLRTVTNRKTFWINLYNASTQILIKANNPSFASWKSRINFFNEKNIRLAGFSLSLNDVEHGMLRHSSVWWSKGYLQKWFPSSLERTLRLPLDYRIHFALNCGAGSCPPVRFYDPDKLETQLETATESFLAATVSFNPSNATVTLSAILDWYRGDFGGKQGILRMLQQRGILASTRGLKLTFSEYDWNLLLHNFSA
jgi:hypothetical protein